jgi:hypothetical protein
VQEEQQPDGEKGGNTEIICEGADRRKQRGKDDGANQQYCEDIGQKAAHDASSYSVRWIL